MSNRIIINTGLQISDSKSQDDHILFKLVAFDLIKAADFTCFQPAANLVYQTLHQILRL